MTAHPATAAIILAGGLARRMGGGDKCRLVVGGQSIITRTIACLRPQAGLLAISANGDPDRFLDLGLPVLADAMPDHPGPLAGILAGLDWAAAAGVPFLVSVPGDCPFLPDDLVARLHRALGTARYAVAGSGGRTHPVAGLWPCACREDLRSALLNGERKIDAFTGRDLTGRAEWSAEPLDPFLNVNTAADLAAANAAAG